MVKGSSSSIDLDGWIHGSSSSSSKDFKGNKRVQRDARARQTTRHEDKLVVNKTNDEIFQWLGWWWSELISDSSNESIQLDAYWFVIIQRRKKEEVVEVWVLESSRSFSHLSKMNRKLNKLVTYLVRAFSPVTCTAFVSSLGNNFLHRSVLVE